MVLAPLDGGRRGRAAAGEDRPLRGRTRRVRALPHPGHRRHRQGDACWPTARPARATASDWGTIDIMLRRSTDGGKTWEPTPQDRPRRPGRPEEPGRAGQEARERGRRHVNNPVAIADRDRRRPLPLLRRVLPAASTCGATTTARPSASRSRSPPAFDAVPPRIRLEGASRPARDTASSSPAAGWSCPSGSRPAPAATPTAPRPRRRSTATTRQVLAARRRSRCRHRGAVNPNETVAGRTRRRPGDAQRPQRVAGPPTPRHPQPRRRDRLVAGRGSTTRCSNRSAWRASSALSPPARGRQGPHPVRQPAQPRRADGKAKPGMSRDRKNLSIKLSYDEGQTWPVNKALEPGYSAYSDPHHRRSPTAHRSSCLFVRAGP